MVDTQAPCYKCNPNTETEPCTKHTELYDCPEYMKWYSEVVSSLSPQAMKMRETMVSYLKALGIEKCTVTCDLCTDRDTCPHSYDPYNTEGDCLEMK